MTPDKKRRSAAVMLLLLGIAILVIGAIGGLAPPIITGLGFFVLAWAMW